MPFGDEAPTCALDESGGIVYCADGFGTNQFAAYNIASNSWTSLASDPFVPDHYGSASGFFNGKVFVRHGAQGTDAMQTNRNLLLSNEARVDTKPQLEIFADDVKCAHGATVGQLEEEALFYLASRGMHTDLARNLLTYGFAEEVIDKIKIESIKAQLDEAVLNRLRARLEA